MELNYTEKVLILDGLKDCIKKKEYIKSSGILVKEMQEEIKELNELVKKIKDSM